MAIKKTEDLVTEDLVLELMEEFYHNNPNGKMKECDDYVAMRLFKMGKIPNYTLRTLQAINEAYYTFYAIRFKQNDSKN